MIFLTVAFLGLLVLPIPVRAHTPGPMTLEYNADTDTLTVTVAHSVSSADHYIASLQLWKNDVSVETKTYTSQESNSGMDDTFTVAAVDGDVLKVTATCSISGFVTEEITVGSGPTTSTTDTSTIEPADSTSFMWLVLAGVSASGIVVIVLVVCLRRR